MSTILCRHSGTKLFKSLDSLSNIKHDHNTIEKYDGKTAVGIDFKNKKS